MAKISGMQRYAEQYAQAKVETAQLLISQYMIDTLQMALHEWLLRGRLRSLFLRWS